MAYSTLKSGFPIIILLLMITAISLKAQFNYNLPQYIDETGEFLRVPLNWQGSDWLKAGGITAATFAMMFIDGDVRDLAGQGSIGTGSIPLEIGRVWGEPYTPPVLGLIILTHGNLTGNTSNKKLGFEILQSYSYNLFVTGLLKIAIGRGRPYLGTGQFDFNPVHIGSNDYWSFPSGHTSVAFTLSTVLAENSNSLLLKTIYYSLASLTGISRVLNDKHWFSDIFLGACIGYFIGKYVTDLHSNGDNFSPPDIPDLITFSIGLN